jgi:hypothetical protein
MFTPASVIRSTKRKTPDCIDPDSEVSERCVNWIHDNSCVSSFRDDFLVYVRANRLKPLSQTEGPKVVAWHNLIAHEKLYQLSPELQLRRFMEALDLNRLRKMSYVVYKSLLEDFPSLQEYACATSTATAEVIGVDDHESVEDDERFSRQDLLMNIARDLASMLVMKDEDIDLDQQQMRAVDMAFAHWPVRYATPSCVEYIVPGDDESCENAKIEFTWSAGDAYGQDETVVFEIWENVTGGFHANYAEWLSQPEASV